MRQLRGLLEFALIMAVLAAITAVSFAVGDKPPVEVDALTPLRVGSGPVDEVQAQRVVLTHDHYDRSLPPH